VLLNYSSVIIKIFQDPLGVAACALYFFVAYLSPRLMKDIVAKISDFIMCSFLSCRSDDMILRCFVDFVLQGPLRISVFLQHLFQTGPKECQRASIGANRGTQLSFTEFPYDPIRDTCWKRQPFNCTWIKRFKDLSLPILMNFSHCAFMAT